MSNPKKILFGNGHRFGDIAINIPCFEVLRQLYPDAKLFLNINKQYIDCSHLYLNQRNIDGIFISDGTDNFPTELDKKNISEMEFDTIYNPNLHRNSIKHGILKNNITINGYHERTWSYFFHSTEDCAYKWDLPICNKQIKLNKWFATPRFEKTIAVHMSGANYDINSKKCFNKEKSQELVDSIIKLGFKVLEVGEEKDFFLNNTIRYNTNFFNSVRNVLGCDLFLGCDSGISWVLSGYGHPSILTYSNEYYMIAGKNCVSSIQPVSDNNICLDAHNVNDISNEIILDKIKLMV